MSLIDRCAAVWETIRRSPAVLPARIALPRSRVDRGNELGGPFKAGEQYIKVADVVLGGVETLLGLATTKPLVALRREFDPDGQDVFEPGYFALIHKSENEVAADRLWVRGNRLVQGDSLAAATPYRDADYV